MDDILLKVEHLQVAYPSDGRFRGPVPAVRDVSFSLAPGDTLGVVGESGCGKTTLGRAVLTLGPEYGGSICFRGRELKELAGRELRAARQRMAMVFQDTLGALNPRRTALESVADAMRYRGEPAGKCVRLAREALGATGLGPDEWNRYPHTLSGGQRQRVAIARALVGRPELLVCDEPVSALDGSIREQILDLIGRLQQNTGAAVLFISHDLRAVESLCRRTAVMYLGRFVETGETESLFADPRHPYTRALLEAVPPPDPCAPVPEPLKGELPNPVAPPSGCPFHPRCPMAQEVCVHTAPELRNLADGRKAACLLAN